MTVYSFSIPPSGVSSTSLVDADLSPVCITIDEAYFDTIKTGVTTPVPCSGGVRFGSARSVRIRRSPPFLGPASV